MALSIMTFSMITFSTMTHNILMLSIMGLKASLSMNNTRHNDIQQCNTLHDNFRYYNTGQTKLIIMKFITIMPSILRLSFNIMTLSIMTFCTVAPSITMLSILGLIAYLTQ